MTADIIAVLGAVAVVLGFITAVLGLINQGRIEKSRIAAEKAATLAARTAKQVAQLTTALEGSDTPVQPPTEGTEE